MIELIGDFKLRAEEFLLKECNVECHLDSLVLCLRNWRWKKYGNWYSKILDKYFRVVFFCYFKMERVLGGGGRCLPKAVKKVCLWVKEDDDGWIEPLPDTYFLVLLVCLGSVCEHDRFCDVSDIKYKQALSDLKLCCSPIVNIISRIW